MLSTNPELGMLLKDAATPDAWIAALDTALAEPRRVICQHNGVTFRDCALTGGFTAASGIITHLGYLSDTTTYLAADLSTGSATLRITGGAHWLEGTLGLTGSGADFLLNTNPTTTNGLAFDSVSIQAPGATPDVFRITFGQQGTPAVAVITEQLYTGMAVGTGSVTQARWRCTPITVPAYERIGGVESTTGNNITFHLFPGLDSDGRGDVWIFAEAAIDAAGTWTEGGPRTASNREYSKVSLAISFNGVPQTLWDGTATYSYQHQRMTMMRWQSAALDWGLNSTYIGGLIAAGRVMPHNSQNLAKGLPPPPALEEYTTYRPFKEFGSLDINSQVGDSWRSGQTGGERDSAGFVHEIFARMVAEVGTHANDAYATANRIATLKNLAESVAQIPLTVISPTDFRLVDPGGDAAGPYVYQATNGSSFIGRLVPFPGIPGTPDAVDFQWDVAHVPNICSNYAFHLSKDPYHLLLVQSMAAACMGATTNTGERRGLDGRTNLIAVDFNERSYWWGLKCLVDAWAATPAGTMPAPFRDKAFFANAIENTLTYMRGLYIGKSSTLDEVISDKWGATHILDLTSTVTGGTYKAVHSLSNEYGAFVLCHMARLGYTGFSDVIAWHARGHKFRAQAGGNYFLNDLTLDGQIGVLVAPTTGADLPYTDAAGWVGWYPATGDKHAGDVPLSEWFRMRWDLGHDAGNYTWQFLGALQCYAHIAAIAAATFDWTPASELAALEARLGGAVGGESDLPYPWVKHYYDF